MAARRIAYLAVISAGVVFYLAYQEWASWLFLILILTLPWFSLLLTLPAIFLFHAEPTGPVQVCVGTPVEVQLVGRCRLPVPPFRGKLRVTRLPTGESWQQKTGMGLPTDHCGGLTITAEKIWVYDYLGIFRLRARHVLPRRILVRPRPVPIGTLPELERYLARSWRPKVGGGFAENHEMRLYRPGDSLNQVHWKLTAKTGKIIIREPMIPDRGLILLTMNLRGTPEELDRKFGRLLWLGQHLLERAAAFEIRALTASGVHSWTVADADTLDRAVDALLCEGPVKDGDLRTREYRASWRYHIGGEPDEA